jgi:SRSO17 transposase
MGYLPQAWAEDQGRGAEAGIPPEAKFATKPALGRRMIERVEQGGVPFRWMTGDEVYGNDGQMWRWLEGRNIFYVLAVSSNGAGSAGRRSRPLYAIGTRS